jgi:hypothetical protein
MNDGQGENEGSYNVSVRRTMREREGRLQKLEQSNKTTLGCNNNNNKFCF